MITAQDALARGNGDWRSFTCPVHDDSNPSARIHVLTGFWVCMSCGAKGRYQGEELEIPEHVVFQAVEKLNVELDVDLPESYMSLYEIPGKYWLDRFTHAACMTWELGTDTNTDTPIYSIRDENGHLIGVVQRGDDDRTKYKYPKGFKSTQHVYGAHMIESNKPIVLVEGAPDVVAMWESGIQAVGTYGSVLHPRQIEIIGSYDPRLVICAYDNDRAGRQGAALAVRALGQAGIMATRAVWPDEYKDVAEMPMHVRANVFRQFYER